MSPTNVLFVFVVIMLNKVGDIPPNFLKSGYKPNKGCLVRFCCVFCSRGRSDLSGLLPSRLPRGEGKGVGLRARAHAAATPTSPHPRGVLEARQTGIGFPLSQGGTVGMPI